MRTFFYRAGKWIWRFMIVFSFLVNIILVLVLLLLGLLIFDIKNNVAGPLVTGLHSSFVGLDQATIDWTIPVREDLPINLNVPINASTITSQVTTIGGVPVVPIAGETVVRLTRDVPIQIRGAYITNGGTTVENATVNISLPAGTELPVALDLAINLSTTIPVDLDVRAVIPLEGTQLHDVANNLRLLFEPLARGLENLPNDFGGAAQMVGDALGGRPPNLLAESQYSQNPWPGFSQTAGLNYTLADEPWPLANQPVETGIVSVGGIPALDEQLRPEVWQAGGPEAVNAQAQVQMLAVGVEAEAYNAAPLDPDALPSGEQSADPAGTDATAQADTASTAESVPPVQSTAAPPVAPTFTPLATSDFSTPPPGG
jgi:hypothetical protein